jgi:serine/threonine-protein kinase
MGEVYRARDTKLGREVAIKVLPEHLAADPERITRLEREAKVLASLNHPYIAALYGMDQSGGQHFLVMELVEGETLAERIRRGPLAVDDALKLAIGIADALEAAHEKAIVHRDLKPSNVKITRDGTVKVLDFGLAKPGTETGGPGATGANLTHSPTLSVMATQAGIILGTAAYMSPEQAQGLPVDHRSDVFSFGCVMYEMLTGRQSFQGETAAALLASVLVKEPDFTALPSNLHPRLLDLLRRCLDKNPKRRWQAVGDLRVELEAVAAAPQEQPSVSAAPSRSWWRLALPVAAAALLAGAAGVGTGWSLQPIPPPAPITRLPLPPPSDVQLTDLVIPVIAISPDGTQVAYSTGPQLYTRPMASLDSRIVAGVDKSDMFTVNPIFSPDSQSIVYWSTGATGEGSALKKIAAAGGPAVTLTPIGPLFGMSWGPDGIVFGQGSGGVMRVSANGGKPEQLVTVKAGEFAHAPQVLPGGETVLFTLSAGTTQEQWEQAKIVVQSLETAERKTVVEAGSDARYLPTGHLVYASGEVLYGVGFDVKRLQAVGGAVPLVEGVSRSTSLPILGPAEQFSVSNTGSLVYIPGRSTSGAQLRLTTFDRKGNVEELKLPPGAYGTPRISPNGKLLAYATDEGKDANIWIYDLSGTSSARRLTFGGKNRLPVWSTNSERVAYQSDREKDLAVFWQRADGAGTAERLTKPEPGTSHEPEAWSPKNDVLLYTVRKESNVALWTLSIGDRKAAPFGDVRSTLPTGAVFSPDGQWIAYSIREPGQSNAVYVQPFPPTGAKYQISKGDDGHHPIWSPDGKELFYVPGANLFSVVSVTTSPSFTLGNPVPLLRRFVEGGPASATAIDIMPDGKRFVGISVAGQLPATGTNSPVQIEVVLNWFEELTQKLPNR